MEKIKNYLKSNWKPMLIGFAIGMVAGDLIF